ncbi:alcohol dehydrogenase catalytic domain-containing protein [Alphaproteobacteria bacterium GH1-50]|uniref:Alcohol dehydrogenase catalytic domain-containing protein n=1 Tax=Kangsaoukella pontilimi TaxID=2691042 RepID=A0A7C9MIE3_9RHOB|nr:alcohol dehydrogenase catalytic domain-containing protein [Kangsaoukella pontilimi]MXQ09696.1 alcohol dehydrogenase catalytic domain-containing protein [Kangsaoukella pontilimi]
MKALVYMGPEKLDFSEVGEPSGARGDALISIESVGICGSDMHAYLGHDERRPAPLILGHEVAGVTDGQRVTVNPLVTCGTCRYCREGRDNLCPTRQIISMPPREGGFAERLTMPPGNLVNVPDHVTADQAALAEPIACGWHAARLSLGIAPGTGRALVFGGGAIGVGSALSLIAQGVADVLVVEPNEGRRAYLEATCGLKAIAPEAIAGEGLFDIIIDGVGYPATRAAASAAAAPGGVIAHIGLGSAEGGLDIRRMTLQEISFVGTYTYTARDFRDTAAAMFDGRLGALDWVEIRPLSEGAQAFADIRAGKVAAPKIILKP